MANSTASTMFVSTDSRQSTDTAYTAFPSQYDPEDLYLDLEERINPSHLEDLELQLLLQRSHVEDTSITDTSVRRFAWLRYTGLNIYRRLFSLVFLANLGSFLYIVTRSRSTNHLLNAAAANLLALGLARQPLVVNLLFLTFASLPRSAPLQLRRLFAKIYCYGGVHSGCGVAAFIWYTALVGVLSYQYAHRTPDIDDPTTPTPAILAIAWTIELLLISIIAAAYPTIRFRLHDYFELTHRFCSWTAIILFWPLLILSASNAAAAQQQNLSKYLIQQPTFSILLIVNLAIVHPWLLLRKRPVAPEPLSTHATRLHFSHTMINFGQGLSLARNPLRDWHSFATFSDVPATTQNPGPHRHFSSLISKAGDWTSHTIANPATHIYTRGIPTYGFGYVMKLFSRIILVTTGSGIGPCLSFVGDHNRPAMRVIWQTRSPNETYGEGVVELVKAMDPEPKILDTKEGGKRVDMLPLVLQLYREFEAEAVAVISNPLVTKKLVWQCERRGVPAFGPIFDS